MKMQLLSAAAVLFIFAQTTLSCNSCEDRNNDPIPTQTPEVGTINSSESDEASLNDGSSTSMDGQSGTMGSSANNSTPSNAGNASGAASTKSTTSKTSKKSATSGYSAPNGTDAENHDGDPYTKHDTTSMPTGTSIR